MATWRVENSMLTQKGVEILNKIKAGSGSITIARIVAGSGRVPESQLFTQTKVSGGTKPMTVTNLNITSTGSEISMYITNEEFTASFALHQIGIYVTHPDYVGEQLYHISQCDEEDFDTIPAVDDTPITLGYNIFLEHGNSSAINLTIDPSGMITADVFNAFRSGVKESKLITADSNGNLVASGKHTVSGTSFSVADAITHRALSLSIEGKATQATAPTISTPVYLAGTKVTSVRNADGGSKSKVITFPSYPIELRSIGDYKDTIEWDGAKWWKVQRIAEVTVDGTIVSFGRPAHANSSAYSRGTIYTLDSASKVQTFTDALPSSPVITSHGNDSPSTSAKFYGFLETVSGTSQVRVQLHILHTAIGLQAGQKDATARLNEILSWITSQNSAGTPVRVYYVLNTPIVTEISLTEVLEMYSNGTSITCNAEGGTPNMVLSYALNTTDDTTMYILKSLARKSDIQVANTFATAELV